MNLWQKLTINWPCALGDWLWAQFVIAPASFLTWLTFRRGARIILQIILVVALFSYFEEIAALHVGPLFAVDANVYLDLFVGVFLFIARGQLRPASQAAMRKIWQYLQDRSRILLRSRARQSHNIGIARREEGAERSKPSDDGPPAWKGARYALV